MSRNGFRLCALNGVLMILAGLVIAGFPLAFMVGEQFYGQASPMPLGGDHRGWVMAHLEGIFNGMMVVLLAGVTMVRPGMKPGREGWLVPAIILAGWLNVVASILAPILSVRGIVFDENLNNNIVAGLFTLGLIPTFAAFYAVIAHLFKRIED